MRYLVTGIKGQLGYDVVRELTKRYPDANVLGVDIDDVDITKEDSVYKFINEYKPDVIFHNAAYTQVDKAELYNEVAYKVNSLGTKYIKNACEKLGAKIIYVSTDYIFDGTKKGCYTEDDIPCPISIYGITKLDGENFVKQYIKHFIVRTSWVFGLNGSNFVKTMLRLSETKSELNVVCDQFGSPTYTVDLARFLVDISETDKYGIYNATNAGYCSWYEFACEIFKQVNKKIMINPIKTVDYIRQIPQQAKRPFNSCMSKNKLIENGFKTLPSWENALERYLKELKEIN